MFTRTSVAAPNLKLSTKKVTNVPVLTIRLSTELHIAFRELAHTHQQSMNQLAVQLLTQAVLDDPLAQAVLRAFEARASNEYNADSPPEGDP